jgi:hypothetical protein
MLRILPPVPIRSHGMLLNIMETNILSCASSNINVLQLERRPVDSERGIASFASQAHTTFLKEE